MTKVLSVKYINDYSLWLSFDDGSSGTVDLHDYLNGPMFEPLKDLDFFKQVYLDENLSTIAWPNGLDIAPEFLRANAH